MGYVKLTCETIFTTPRRNSDYLPSMGIEFNKKTTPQRHRGMIEQAKKLEKYGKKGGIVLYKRDSGAYVLHRIIGISKAQSPIPNPQSPIPMETK